MAHAPYIIACFAITAAAMAWLALSSYLNMRRSEALADDLRVRD
jgi:heme exporter protein CcmD